MPRSAGFVPLFVLCLRVTVGAQAPPLHRTPDSAKQAEMLAHLKAFASEYDRNMPGFSCVQRSGKDSDTIQAHFNARSVVLIDLGSRQVAQNGLPATVPTESFLRDLLLEDSQFTFVRWATLHKAGGWPCFTTAKHSLASNGRRRFMAMLIRALFTGLCSAVGARRACIPVMPAGPTSSHS